MGDRKKGFDPLASLFDGPDLRDFPGSTAPLPEVDDSEFDAPPESTDPLISMPVDGVPLEMLKGGGPGGEPKPAPVPDRAREVPTPSALDVPEPGGVEVPEPIPPEPVVEEPVGPSAENKAELAKALARAAIAKAKAAQQAAEAEAPPEPKKSKTSAGKARRRHIPPPPDEEDEVEEAKAPTSRLAGLASRAPRMKSALEAARAAAEAEAVRKQAADVERLLELPTKVDRILRRQLKGIKTLDVVNALMMDDRTLLTALWKGHRARFAAIGQLGEVVSTTNVIRSLGAVPQGQLVAAIVETEVSDYLVWVDIGSEATIAAFADARAWYASARKT